MKRNVQLTIRIFMITGIISLVGILALLKFTSNQALIYPHATLVSQKETYKPAEKIVLKLKLGPENTASSLISKVFADEKPTIDNFITIDGKRQLIKPQLASDKNGEYSISIPSGQQFRPGTYTLNTIIKNSDGEHTLKQDFSWGVLAVNTNKSIYKSDETAKLSISVLNEGGFNTCDAKVTLIITDSKGKETKRSTDDKSIKVSDECWGSNATYTPDYSTSYKTGAEGQYEIELSATTKNGTYSITDSFFVDNNADFVIERFGPTRINPVAPYEMKIKVTASRDFSGKIIETLPFSFSGNNTSGGTIESNRERNTFTMTWDKDIKKGQTINLSYNFDAPDISPEFYLIKPLMFSSNNYNFSESRHWQIAADPTKLIMLWDNFSSTPSGWTCVSCSTGDTFFQKFIRGAASYNAAGGGTDSHTATVNTNTVNTTATERGTGANAGVSTTAHTHTSTNPTIGSANNIPVYRNLRVISYDAGIPSGASAIPSGAIGFFDAAVPTGWTRYSAQDASYIRGDWTSATGGSNTHTHTVTWNSIAGASGSTSGGNNANRGATDTHTHTAPSAGATASSNNEPPYIETILGKADSTTSLPIGMIGMFDGAAGTGWSDVSQAAQAFNNVFPKPAATYSTTGGAATHSHTNVTSGVSGGPSATQQAANAGSGVAGENHTHTITTSFNAGDNNLPAYVDVLMAKRQVAITGTVKQSDESTAIGNPPCDGSTAVISARVNGGAAVTATCAASDSTFSITVDATSGQIITLYLTSTAKANAVIVVGASSEITGVDMYENGVIVRDEGTGGVTSANMGQYDNDTNATDMLFTVDGSNNLSVESNIELHVWIGDTFSPSGTVTTQGTGDLHLDDSSTSTLGSATNTIGDDILIDTSASLTISANTIVAGGAITATGTLASSGTPTVTVRGTGNISGAGTKTIYNLAVGDATTATTTLTGNLTVSNDVTVGTGSTFNVNADLAVNGGDFTNTTTGIIDTTSGTPTVTMSGTGTLGSGNGNITFYNLVTSGTGTTTFSGGGTNSVTNNITVGAGTTLNINSTIAITGNITNTTTGIIGTSAGTPNVTVSGTSIGGGSGAITFYNLTKSGAGTTTFSGSGTNSVTNVLSISAGTFTLSNALTVTSDVTVATGATINVNHNLNVNGGDFTTTGTGVINTTSGTPTVTMSGTGALGGGNGNITFYNLATSGTGTTTFTGGGTNSVTNNVTVGAGTTLTIGSSIAVTGNLTNTTTGIIASTGTPTVTVQGTTLGSGSGDITIYNLIKSGAGTTTFSGSGTNTITTNLAVSAGTLTQNSALTVTGDISVATGSTFNTNATLNVSGGDLTTAGTGVVSTTAGTATTTLSNTGNIGGGGTVTVYNLALSGAGTHTLQSAVVANNDISVATGQTLELNSNSLTVSGGDLTTAGTGTVTCASCTAGTLTVSGTGTLGGGGTITAYNLTVNGTQSASSALLANRLLTIGGSGALSMGANNLTVGSSSVANSGGIANSGTITQSSSATTTILSSSAGAASVGGSGSTTFYNLTIAPTVASAPTITLGTGASQTINVTNILTIGNGSNNVTVTASTNDPTINVDGNFSISSTGAFTSTGGMLSVAGNFSNSGTFTHDSGTVQIDGSGTTTLSGTGSPAITFHNFTANTASKTLNFTAGQTFRVNGLLTIDNQTIDSTTTSKWYINHQGTESVTNSTITNSGCDGTSTLITVDVTDTSGGNNDTCWDFASVIYPNPVKFVGSGIIKGNVRIRN